MYLCTYNVKVFDQRTHTEKDSVRKLSVKTAVNLLQQKPKDLCDEVKHTHKHKNNFSLKYPFTVAKRKREK